MYSGNRIVWWSQPVNSIGLFWLWHPSYRNKLRTNLHHLNSTAFQHSMGHLCMACPNVEVILAGMLGIVKCRRSFPGYSGFLTTAFMARPNVDMILLKGEVIKCRRSLRRERCNLMVSQYFLRKRPLVKIHWTGDVWSLSRYLSVGWEIGMRACKALKPYRL